MKLTLLYYNLLLPDPAAADRRGHAGGGGAGGREGEEEVHGGAVPRPLRAGLHAGAPGKTWQVDGTQELMATVRSLSKLNADLLPHMRKHLFSVVLVQTRDQHVLYC